MNKKLMLWADVMNEQWQINNLISWKFLFKNRPHKFILKSNWRITLTGLLDPFKQVKSAEHMAKNQFQVHSVVFCHADVKM